MSGLPHTGTHTCQGRLRGSHVLDSSPRHPHPHHQHGGHPAENVLPPKAASSSATLTAADAPAIVLAGVVQLPLY